MRSQLELLIKLQDCDSTILKAKRVEDDYPHNVKLLEDRLDAEKSELQDQEKHFEEIKKKRLRKEQDLAAEEEKVQKAKEKLTTVKTNKEYHAALKEIEAKEKLNSKLEEEILLIMEESDQLKKTIEAKDAHLKLTIKESEKEKIALEEKLAECVQEIKEQQKLKEELLSQIEGDLLDLYQRILKKRTPPIVIHVEDNCCQGCNMNIPPQLFNEIKKCEKIINCPHCNRILFWKENHHAEPATQQL